MTQDQLDNTEHANRIRAAVSEVNARVLEAPQGVEVTFNIVERTTMVRYIEHLHVEIKQRL